MCVFVAIYGLITAKEKIMMFRLKFYCQRKESQSVNWFFYAVAAVGEKRADGDESTIFMC